MNNDIMQHWTTMATQQNTKPHLWSKIFSAEFEQVSKKLGTVNRFKIDDGWNKQNWNKWSNGARIIQIFKLFPTNPSLPSCFQRFELNIHKNGEEVFIAVNCSLCRAFAVHKNGIVLILFKLNLYFSKVVLFYMLECKYVVLLKLRSRFIFFQFHSNSSGELKREQEEKSESKRGHGVFSSYEEAGEL